MYVPLCMYHYVCEAFEHLEKKIKNGDIHSTDAADQSSTTTTRIECFSTATVTTNIVKEKKNVERIKTWRMIS